MSDTEVASFPIVFAELCGQSGASLTTIRAGFDAILSGAWNSSQVAGFAVALRMRGESAPVIAAAAEAMRRVMIRVPHGLPAVVDTCGTGGDGKGSINLSTIAAIIVAAAGFPVAKHGNRSVSSRAGSADVVEALGLPLDLGPERHAELLSRIGITFIFAPAHHPALRHAAVARRELAVRTIFNALGPIANPAGATHQLVGAYDDGLRPILAATLSSLGTRHAWIVRGQDGLDEISPFGPTLVSELSAGHIEERVVTPEDFGLERAPTGALDGGDAKTNAVRIEGILSGVDDPARSSAILNAAAAIAIAREATGGDGLREAAEIATRQLDSGAALRTLAAWREATGAPR